VACPRSASSRASGFQNDQISGQGTYFFSNGDLYVGPWLRGERDGRGSYTDASGNTQAMEFRGGQRLN